ncbi:MAG: O-antigen ligase family protein [Thermomicrobiales bacterium]
MQTAHHPLGKLSWPTSYPWLIQTLVVASCGVIGLVGLRLVSKGPTLLVLGLAGAILAVLFLLRPHLGMYVVVVGAGVVRVQAGTGTGSPIVASLACALLLCGCWIVHQIVYRRPIVLLPRIVAWPGLALMGFSLFSLLWGRATLDPRIIVPGKFIFTQIGGTALFLVSIGLLFVGADLLRDRETRNWIVIVILAVGFGALPLRALNKSDALFSVFGLFGAWFVALCWAHALTNTRLAPRVRWLLAAGALGWLAVQLTREFDWTSGWLPPAIAFILIIAIVRPRIGVPLIGLGLVLLVSFPQVVNQLVNSEESQGSLGGDFGRTELWMRNIELLKDHLLFGTGPAGYALYYMTFVPTEAMSSHSNYIDVLAETGIPGLLSFLALFGGLGWIAWRLKPRLTDASDRATCIAMLAALPAVLAAMALGDWVIPFVYNQTIAGFDYTVYSWLVFALVCGMWAQQRYGDISDA